MIEGKSNFKNVVHNDNQDEDLAWIEDDKEEKKEDKPKKIAFGVPFKQGVVSNNKNELERKEVTSSIVSAVSSEGRPSINDIRLQGIKGERIRRVVSDVIYLINEDPSWEERGVIDKIKKYHKFIVKDALHIIKGLQTNNIEYDPTDYKITIEKLPFRSQFRDISEYDYKLLFPAFSERQCRLYRVIRCLKQLIDGNPDVDYNGKISYYLQEEAFTPKELNWHFTKLNYQKIEYKPSDFRVSIKRDKDKAQFGEMKERQIMRIWPALTKYQKTVYNEEYSEYPIPLDLGLNE